MRRLGAGSGFAGDRIDPAVDLAQRGELDALVFECLAERTILRAQQARMAGHLGAFDPLWEERLRATLAATAGRGTLLITNAGAADPVGAAELAVRVAKELGLAGLDVAAVEGDDVLADLELSDSPVLGGRDGETLADHKDALVSANAYLGTEGLLAALDAGAHVVVTGRTSDTALFLAPLMHWFGWSSSSWDRLASGTVVGHLLECAGQLTGGYFDDGTAKRVKSLARLGFPMADVAYDGSARFHKLPGTGGRLDQCTVLEQLLYEVADPSAYVTPDVVVDFSEVAIDETGPDEVIVSGAVGAPAPELLKVSVGVNDGFRAVAEISYAGPHCRRRAQLAADVVAERWTTVHRLSHVEVARQLVGINSCTPWTGEDEHPEPAEVRLRLAATTHDERAARALCREVEALYTNGPAGGGGVEVSVAPALGLLSTLIPRHRVSPRVRMLR